MQGDLLANVAFLRLHVFGHSAHVTGGFLALALKWIPVGIAYAIWAGVGIALISIAGAVLFKQMLDTPAIIGIGLIVAGVALQAGLFLQPSPPPPIIASMYSAVVIMALVTTVLTPLILRRLVSKRPP